MGTQRRAAAVLIMSTFAFTVCFAAWMLNGVLITYLVDRGIYQWDRSQLGWLIGTPVLTGSIMRLPLGMLTDRYGGRIVFPVLMLLAAVPMFLLSYANSFSQFLLLSFGFGLAGASFAVGVAYTSVWFTAKQQGTALGIFGMGNLGTALTSMGAPVLLRILTGNGANLEGWRDLPRLYAGLLAITAVAFWLLVYSRRPTTGKTLSLGQRLAPMHNLRVWRFGLYYYFFFGGFVAISQWLVPYYVNMYFLSVAVAGLLAAAFSLPAGLARPLGGWLADRWGARAIMYFAFGTSLVVLILLFPPRMEIQTPGQGIMAERAGTVTEVSGRHIIVDEGTYQLQAPTSDHPFSVRIGVPGNREPIIFFPSSTFRQEPLVRAGDRVEKGQLLARGVSSIAFQANMWILAGLTVILGIVMGFGSAAVYKHVAVYFPENVGVVGGIVGVLGGLGGFVNPIVFGYVLKAVGVWTTCWMLLSLVGMVCLVWMHRVIQRMMRREAPGLMRQIEQVPPSV